MKQLLQIFSIFSLCLFTACGPVYHTDYLFTPPKTESGRACVYHCEASKTQCQTSEDIRADSCQTRAELERDRCERDVYYRTGKSPKWYECGTDSCSADYERCEQSYRSCYQSCGGRVEADTRCVSGCDKIPPAPPPPARSRGK